MVTGSRRNVACIDFLVRDILNIASKHIKVPVLDEQVKVGPKCPSPTPSPFTCYLELERGLGYHSDTPNRAAARIPDNHPDTPKDNHSRYHSDNHSDNPLQRGYRIPPMRIPDSCSAVFLNSADTPHSRLLPPFLALSLSLALSLPLI